MPEESRLIEFRPGPDYVVRLFDLTSSFFAHLMQWCWGWDGAGEISGPDVEAVWEPVPAAARSPDSIKIRHDRSF